MNAIFIFALVLAQNDPVVIEHPNWPQLKWLIENPNTDVRVRVQSMRIACQNADQSQAVFLVEKTRQLAGEIDTEFVNFKRALKEGPLHTKILLVGTAVFDGRERLEQPIPDHAVTLSLWRLIACSRWCNYGIRDQCCANISSNGSPLALRQDAALAIVRDALGFGGVTEGSPLWRLFDSSTFPALRQILLQHSDPDHFNYSAVNVLSYYGDEAILPHLEACRPAFRAKDAQLEGLLESYEQNIQIQHPPENLLHILSGENSDLQQWQSWALRRAVELGLPTAQIRAAILQCASHVPHPSTQPAFFEMLAVKKYATEHNVIQADDLAEFVPPPPGHWTDCAFPINGPIRPAGPLVLPTGPQWKPRQKGYEELAVWARSADLTHKSKAEADRLLFAKQCELGLQPPWECIKDLGVASSQSSPGS